MIVIAGAPPRPPARSLAEIEVDLAAALRRVSSRADCPRYLEDVAAEWLDAQEREHR